MGLAEQASLHLSIAASAYLPETMRYARKQFSGKQIDFANRKKDIRASRIENNLLSFFTVNSLPTKVIREGFYRTRKFLKADELIFDTNDWYATSIYHSPFYPIPLHVARDERIPVVQTIHDLIPIFHPEWFLHNDDTIRRVLTRLPERAYIVTNSEATKHDFCQHTQIDPDRVISIHLAASSALFYPEDNLSSIQAVRKQYGIGEAPYLLSLATFEPRKNIDKLICCFERLLKSNQLPAGTKLVLVGAKGWKFEEVMKQLKVKDATRNQIIVTGFVPDHQLAALYAGATCFVYLSAYEGFGLPVLEAMQCGLPVIVSDIPSLNEVAGDAGTYVRLNDIDEIGQAIALVANSESIQQNKSVAGLERAALFSWTKFIDQHVALYRTIAAEHNAVLS